MQEPTKSARKITINDIIARIKNTIDKVHNRGSLRRVSSSLICLDLDLSSFDSTDELKNLIKNVNHATELFENNDKEIAYFSEQEKTSLKKDFFKLSQWLDKLTPRLTQAIEAKIAKKAMELQRQQLQNDQKTFKRHATIHKIRGARLAAPLSAVARTESVGGLSVIHVREERAAKKDDNSESGPSFTHS